MFIPRFTYHAPASLAEALALLAKHGKDVVPLAGGTDLMIMLKEGRLKPERLMALRRIAELKISDHDNPRSFIGANLAIGKLEGTSLVKNNPAFADFLSQMGTLQVRNRATLGGNLCSAATCADGPPILMISDGRIHLQSAQGERVVTPTEFFTAERETLRRSDELLTGISLIQNKPGSAYIKFGQRKAGNIAVVGVAVSLEVEDGQVKSLALAGTAVAPIPVDGQEVAKLAIGLPAEEKTWQMLADGFDQIITPRSNLRASSDYRRHLARLGVKRACKLSLKRLEAVTRG